MIGKRKKDTKSIVIVKTKEELKSAIKRKEDYIEVQGELANKMKWMGKLSKERIIALTALLATATFNPLTAGGTMVIQGAVGASEAGSVVLLTGFLGAATIYAIYKGYNVEAGIGDMTLRLTRK